MLWIILICIAFTWLYFYYKRKYSLFSSLGIPTPPVIWGIGNLHQRLFVELNEMESKWIEKYGPMHGAYIGTIPFLSVSEPEIAKKVLIKDFHYFVNRVQSQAYHELWNKNLFSANDDAWKRIRTITSPSFTAGRLRSMSRIMRRAIDKLDHYFANNIDQNASSSPTDGTKSGLIDTKQVMAGFSIDVIASTSFATETDANAETNSPFVVNGRKIFDINPIRGIFTFLAPKWLLRLARIDTFFDPKVFNFFINLTQHIVGTRKRQLLTTSSAQFNDLVQLLMDASVDVRELERLDYSKMTIESDDHQNGEDKSTTSISYTSAAKNSSPAENDNKKRQLTDSEIIANCIFFFVAGFETTASTLTFAMYELAKNPSIQDRLADELRATLSDLEDEAYLDAVMHRMPYLEAVIKETLRLYPPLSSVQRICATDQYPITDQIRLPKGTVVSVSIAGIHHNAKYYTEPLKFNPDRFMPENRHLLTPYAYLPFSLGPRNCIAMRFAYQELRLCFAHILQKYRFTMTPETPAKLSFKVGSALSMCESFPLRVERR